MSLEQARACIEKMRTDGAFCARILAVEDLAARLQLINTQGFDCTAKEFEQVSAELSDTDLAAVSGGGYCPQVCKRVVR